MHVCPCAGPIPNVYTAGDGRLRFVSVQQISAVKYFFPFVLQLSTDKLRGKSETRKQKRLKKMIQNVSLAVFAADVAVISFSLFLLLFMLFLSLPSLPRWLQNPG